MEGPVVVVDAYSSARHFAPLFRARGFDCLHVCTQPDVPAVYRSSYRPADFVGEVVHLGDTDTTLRQVAEHRPVAVLAGVESGVELADVLSEQLGLATNGSRLSSARRDKHLMIERVKAAGLRGTEQIEGSDWVVLRSWYQRVGGRVVVKPLRSLGNDGVFFCDNEEEVRKAVESVLGSRSVLAEDNGAVVVQEYVQGTEYSVNTVSLDGEHYVCDMWEQQHLNINGVRDLLGGSRLLAAEGPEQDRLTDYVRSVLDALGIRNGPAHTEVRLTASGPCLIEVGARVCGADIPVLAATAIGQGQLDLTVDAYTDPQRFAQRCATAYQVKRYAANVHLVSPRAGVLRDYPRLQDVADLESFHEAKPFVQPGQRLSVTVDDFTYPLMVRLLHDSEGAVRRDFASIRQLDGDGFYLLDS